MDRAGNASPLHLSITRSCDPPIAAFKRRALPLSPGDECGLAVARMEEIISLTPNRFLGALICVLAPLAALALSIAPFAPAGAEMISEPSLRADPFKIAVDALARGDFDAARAGFEKLNRANPNAAAPYLGLAEVAIKAGDPTRAEATVDLA